MAGARHLVGDFDGSEEVGPHSLRVTALLLRLQEVVAVRSLPVRRRVALVDRVPAQQPTVVNVVSYGLHAVQWTQEVGESDASPIFYRLENRNI